MLRKVVDCLASAFEDQPVVCVFYFIFCVSVCLPFLLQVVTESFGATIHAVGASQLTDGVIRRSKRMMLDTLGVGLLGSRTDVVNKALEYSQVHFTSCKLLDNLIQTFTILKCKRKAN